MGSKTKAEILAERDHYRDGLTDVLDHLSEILDGDDDQDEEDDEEGADDE